MSGSPAHYLGALRASATSVCSRLLRQEGGIAAVEFSLILPIMLVLWIGGVEVTGALSFDRKLNNLTSAIGDLTARSKTLDANDMTEIFQVANGVMYPFDIVENANTLKMRVTAVKIDKDKKLTVAWKRESGSPPAQGALGTIVPASLQVPNSQLIMAEAYFTYKPAVGYVITGDLQLEDRMFFVPRLVAAVEFCTNKAVQTTCQS